MTTLSAEAYAQSVTFDVDTLIVQLRDGRSLSAPLEWFPRLRDASETDRQQWRLIGQGIGIHWDTLDEDVSVRGLLQGKRADHHAE